MERQATQLNRTLGLDIVVTYQEGEINKFVKLSNASLGNDF
jgi:hypothetical protein